MGPTGAVYLRTNLTDQVLDRLDNLLQTFPSKITDTKKGREWTLCVSTNAETGEHPFDVHAWETVDRLWDCQEELEELGLTSSELPTYIAITAGRNQPIDWEILCRLLHMIACELDGLKIEPQ